MLGGHILLVIEHTYRPAEAVELVRDCPAEVVMDRRLVMSIRIQIVFPVRAFGGFLFGTVDLPVFNIVTVSKIRSVTCAYAMEPAVIIIQVCGDAVRVNDPFQQAVLTVEMRYAACIVLYAHKLIFAVIMEEYGSAGRGRDAGKVIVNIRDRGIIHVYGVPVRIPDHTQIMPYIKDELCPVFRCDLLREFCARIVRDGISESVLIDDPAFLIFVKIMPCPVTVGIDIFILAKPAYGDRFQPLHKVQTPSLPISSFDTGLTGVVHVCKGEPVDHRLKSCIFMDIDQVPVIVIDIPLPVASAVLGAVAPVVFQPACLTVMDHQDRQCTAPVPGVLWGDKVRQCPFVRILRIDQHAMVVQRAVEPLARDPGNVPRHHGLLRICAKCVVILCIRGMARCLSRNPRHAFGSCPAFCDLTDIYR